MGQGGAYWVFGYGSLMWDPGFAFAERQLARLYGYHRRFCLYSHRYRGTPDAPGLVLGLDRGGSCRGVAYRIADADIPAVKAYLWEREMVSNAYRPLMLPVALGDGERVAAQCFVIDPCHCQYAGRLDLDLTARLIATSEGERGPNIVYLENTVEHLRAVGVRDRALEQLATHARRLMAEGGVERPALDVQL